MGLTIHYTLSVREPLTSAEARALVGRARAFARESEAESVSPLIKVESDFPLAHEWLVLPRSRGGATHVDVPPEAGHIFTVDLGGDCEALLLGLCRYPSTVKHRESELPTKVGGGWRLSYFCKTHYAGRQGWEHFLRCHRTAIELLNSWRTLGVNVRIKDEGGYWPHRSERILRARLDEMNGVVAAMGGALKDDSRGLSVESPIFEHPHFERLEHQGQQQHGAKMRDGVAAIAKAARRR
jgi:hypothetical protein